MQLRNWNIMNLLLFLTLGIVIIFCKEQFYLESHGSVMARATPLPNVNHLLVIPHQCFKFKAIILHNCICIQFKVIQQSDVANCYSRLLQITKFLSQYNTSTSRLKHNLSYSGTKGKISCVSIGERRFLAHRPRTLFQAIMKVELHRS